MWSKWATIFGAAPRLQHFRESATNMPTITQAIDYSHDLQPAISFVIPLVIYGGNPRRKAQPMRDIPQSCPTHKTFMVPHTFEPAATLPGVEVFRCPNLSCSIFYAKGVMEGFYTRKANGELVPYSSSKAAS
jgi:hypothetical protein